MICPRCGANSIEFSERYRLPQAGGPTAAWVCDSPACGYAEPVRRDDKLRFADRRRQMASMRMSSRRRPKKTS